jgi:hypothetical protein
MRTHGTHFHVIAAQVAHGVIPLSFVLGRAAGEEQDEDEHAQTLHGVSLRHRMDWFRGAIPISVRGCKTDAALNGAQMDRLA